MLSEESTPIVDKEVPDNSVTVAVDDIVTLDVSLTLGEVEPDVRLNITFPTFTGNGSTLPFVLFSHLPDEELPGPQQ